MKFSNLVNPAVMALTLLTLLVGLSATAQAREIYTWTDQDGVVHYVDTPPDNQDAVLVDVPEAYRPDTVDTVYPETAAPAAAAGEDGEEPVAEELSYADQKRTEMAERRHEKKKQQAAVASACGRARQRLVQIEPNRRVFYTDESGETVRMDDEDRVAEVADMRAFLAENCD